MSEEPTKPERIELAGTAMDAAVWVNEHGAVEWELKIKDRDMPRVEAAVAAAGMLVDMWRAVADQIILPAELRPEQIIRLLAGDLERVLVGILGGQEPRAKEDAA